MKMTGKLLPVLLCIHVQTLFPLPPQKLLYSDDWAYEALSILSREQRIVFFADSVITVAQMRDCLDAIDEETLSESGKVLLRRLEAYLASSPWISAKSGALSAGIDIAVQGETYCKSSPDIPWIHDYHSRNPLLQMPANISLGPYISLELVPFAGQNEYAASLHNNYVNIPYDPVHQFDIHFPRRSYLSAGIPFGEASGIHFAIGIGEDFLGRTRTGSVILSDYMNKVTYARLSLYSPSIKYAAEIKQFEVNKYLYMHYLHVRPHRIFSLTFTEGVMVNAPLELRFLNPTTVFHGFESYKTYDDYNDELNITDPRITDPTGGSRIGSYFGVKIEFQPVKYLRFYGLFAMDQLQLGIEKDNWSDDLTPDALAFQAGTELSVPVSGGYWNFGLEGVYTYPYMYVLHNKKWSFVKEYPEIDNMTVRDWVGSPFGPDTIAGTFWTGYASSRWSLTFSFVFAAQGERSGTDIFDTTNYWPTPAVYDVVVPPTGIPVYTATAVLLWEWTPREWIHIRFEPGYRFVNNSGHVRGQKAYGFEAALSVKFVPAMLKTYEFN
ncbi:MAG: hypothetical protein LBG26_02270 [Treponema sp.]|jgi:hypothetical protein|nr:hypothetical protein [Treponema sp.]